MRALAFGQSLFVVQFRSMKTTANRLAVYFLLGITTLLGSCSKDGDESPKPRLVHTGEKWNIASVEYTIIDQNLSDPSQWIKTGTKTNAGAFYFNGTEGSFDIVIDKSRLEDYFSYTDDAGDLTIISIEQSVSTSKISQNVIVFNGEKTTTTINVSGTVTNQNLAEQYVFTGTFELVKD